MSSQRGRAQGTETIPLPTGNEEKIFSDRDLLLDVDEEFYFFFTASLHRGQVVGKVQSCCLGESGMI